MPCPIADPDPCPFPAHGQSHGFTGLKQGPGAGIHSAGPCSLYPLRIALPEASLPSDCYRPFPSFLSRAPEPNPNIQGEPGTVRLCSALACALLVLSGLVVLPDPLRPDAGQHWSLHELPGGCALPQPFTSLVDSHH